MAVDIVARGMAARAITPSNWGASSPNKLARLRKAMAQAAAFNPVDAVVAATLPTITTAFDGALSTFFTAQNSQAGGNYMNLLGGVPVQGANLGGSVYAWSCITTTSPGPVNGLGAFVFEFFCDAPKLQIRQAAGTPRVEVDGYFLSKSGTATGGGGGEQQLVLDWSGARKTRLYRLHMQGGTWVSRIGVDALSRVWAPSTDHIRGIYLGDSYVGGTGATYGDSNFAGIASHLLGITDPQMCGIGGTGYLQVGTAWKFRDHISDFTGRNPDLVAIAGGTNDAAAGITTEVGLLLAAIRAPLPNVPIVVLGPWPKNTGPSQTILDVEAAVSAGVTAFNDPLCKFAPVAADAAGSWIFGTGKIGATNGSGNSDVYIGADGAHPGDTGYEYLGRRAAAAVSAALYSMSP